MTEVTYPPPPKPRASTQIGAYRLVKQIGAGGMGEVWLAEHTLLGRKAAIKLLHASFSNRHDIVTRFFNEARAATAIADPGIVQIFDFGQHTDGSAYIVMELLDGETLDARVRRRGLTVPDALRIMRQVASSLGAAHQRGIVHRDLKPENIFVVRDPEVPGGERAKILDFGIAKLVDGPGPKTHTSALMGTPTFMSPEQCRGAGLVDQRSDIYSLGCVLFAITTGRPPFEGEGSGDLIVKHMSQPAPRASTLMPTMPEAVDDLIARCLDKDPARRFESGADLARAIGELSGHSLEPAPTLRSPPPPMLPPTLLAPAVQTTLSGSAVSVSPPERPRRGVAIGVGLLVVAGLSVGGLQLRGVEPEPVAPTVMQSEPSRAPPPPREDPEAPLATPPVAPPQPAPIDERPSAARQQLVDAANTFVRWSARHASDPCPRAGDLGLALDPWGNNWTITCVDQLDGFRIGIVSQGADRAPRTADDLQSWELEPGLLVGSRWPAKVAKQRPTPQPSNAAATKAEHASVAPASIAPTPAPTPTPTPTPTDDIPVTR